MAWVQQVAERFGATEDARAGLQDVQVVIAVDRKGRQLGVAYGADHLKRITESGQDEALRIIPVLMDGTADRLFGQPRDLELLMAIVLTVKNETGDLDDDGHLVNVRPRPEA